MFLQGEVILELPDHPLDDLPLARCPPARLLWPRPPSAFLWGRRDKRSVDLQPLSLPLDRGETFVGEEGVMAIGSYQELAYGTLVAVRGG